MRATFLRRAVPLVGAFLVLLAVLAPQASATVTLSANDTNPAVGNAVTFTAATVNDCGARKFTFAVDGEQRPAQTSASYAATFTTTGSHTVSVDVEFRRVDDSLCAIEGDSATVTVGAAPGGAISTATDPPQPGVATTLGIVHAGGRAPFSGYRWTINGVADPAGDNRRSYPKTFATAGTYEVAVTFTDTGDASINEPAHTGRVTKTVTVVAPAAPAPGQAAPAPAPPAPPCTSTLAFALSEFKTDGCFTKVSASPEQWATTDRVRLNGIAFADTGQRFVITLPTAQEPGGHVKTDNTAIELDRFIPFSGNVDWTLPAGKQGEVGTLREIAVPSFAKLFKLRVAGSIAIKLGWDANGKRYATFPLNVELPPAFTAGPTRFSGGVSGAASLRVDDDGIKYDGLKVAVSDVWVGRLKIVSACFSYLPANGQAVAPCEAPELDGQPYIQCTDDATTDRWDGNAVIELPTASQTKLAAFGGLADGRVSKLGGFVDGLGTTVPIVPGVFLNRVGVGLCLSPPPFKLRGDVGVTALGGQLDVNGRILYTDATESAPWRLEVGGNVKFAGTQLGDAQVGFNGWGDVDFAVNAKMDLASVASISGSLNGWIEPRNRAFTIAGSVQGCITGLTCATANGLVSNVGIAGCLDLGSFTVTLPSEVREGPFGFGSVRIITRTQTVTLRAGFGYRYGSSVSLLGNSCDLSGYASARTAQAAGAGLSERIRGGTRAVAFRVSGTDGPPKIVVRGPGGTTISSPQTGTALQRKGRFVLAENPSDGTTSVLLLKPAAGTWTVTAAPGAASKPRRIARSSYELPSVLFGQVRTRRGGERQAAVQYAVPAGATVRVLERGKGISRTIARSLRGKPCRGVRPLADGRTVRCAVLRFDPARGPGGTRGIEAIVSRGGIPLARKDLARFRVASPSRPARPASLSVRRVNGGLVAVFPRTAGASRFTATAVLADGRSLGFDLASSCRALRIPGVGAGDKATIKVAGVRYDLVVGTYRRVVLDGTKTSVGPKAKLPKRICS